MTLVWIVGSGLLMSAIALVGSVTLLLREKTLDFLVTPLVAFAAGSLLGGAFFHMLPAATGSGLPTADAALWLMVGFTVFLALEQFLHWHHCHRASAECKQPLT
jgi:zinc and cadmium transporter